MKPGRTACWILAASLMGCGGDPTATDPKLLFKDGFLTPAERVEILADGGTMVRGLDGWLKLQPLQGEVEPRNRDNYRYRDCAVPVAWFRDATGDQALRPGFAGLTCLEAVDPRFDFDNGRWLVEDRNRGLVFYRIWKKFNR